MLLPLSSLLVIVIGIVSVVAQDISQCPIPDSPQSEPGRIRPRDIMAVMAMGDSLVAALAAKTHIRRSINDDDNNNNNDDEHHPNIALSIDSVAVMEYRGIGFATGADLGALTVHTLMRHYNPELVGGSRGAHPVPLCPGGRLCDRHDLGPSSYPAPLQDRLNVALSGASINTLGIQLKQLRRQISHVFRGTRANPDEVWKLLILHIGTADLCQYGCIPNIAAGSPGSGDYFETRLRLLLDGIREKLPRTLISLLLLPDASQLGRFLKKHGRAHCRDAIPIARAECPCAVAHEDQARWSLSAATADYNERILRVAVDYRDIVHVSAVLRDLLPHKHLSPAAVSALDCIQLGTVGHRALAIAYWHSLFQPFSLQQTHIKAQPDEDAIFCPGPDDYIRLFEPDGINFEL